MSTSTPNDAEYWEKEGATGLLIRAVLRGLQCVFALVVVVIYALDLRRATQDGVKPDSTWIYAEFVAGLPMLVCISHLFLTTIQCRWTILDRLLFILWMAQFAVFAPMYIGSGKPPKNERFKPSQSRVRSVVWINLVGMLLWLATTIQGTSRCRARRQKRRQKGDLISLSPRADAFESVT
ncbi:hypothetical protein MRS44_018447 [Fusarium solani]|jgi:hypothetical protein|uniref:uncharacterized protein n=1 Tax=Fusarium solani TaxID=169388 RepID=UPI0032C47C60|nr:hypothetical protein MRS44_018447 [Fusarium solani]